MKWQQSMITSRYILTSYIAACAFTVVSTCSSCCSPHSADLRPLCVQVYYTVDKIGEGKGDSWKGGVGYVTREMTTSHIPPPSDDNLILVCGPPPMYKALSGDKAKDKSQGDPLHHHMVAAWLSCHAEH